MGSPAVFAGKFTKLLTSRGILNSNGNINENNGAKDYMLNGTFETGTLSPWTAVSTTFTNGVPGALSIGTGSLTLALNSTATLSGSNDLIVTKPASNCQGSGFSSGVLTVDKEDSAKMLFGAFSYQASNTNFDASGSSTQSFEIWILDVTATAALGSPQWIQPIGYRGINQNSGVGKCTFSFQTPGTNASNQYRVVVFTNQTSTLGFAVEVDNFSLGPVAQVIGAVVTDWVSYTPTIVGFGTPTGINFKSRRVGDSLEVVGYFTAGTSTATQAQIGLGYAGAAGNVVVDTSKVPTFSVIGSGAINVGATNYFGIAPISPGANQSYINIGVQNSTTSEINGAVNGSSLIGATGLMSLSFQVPIVGWLSNVQMSSDSSAAVIATKATLSAASASFTTGVIGKVAFDTANSASGGYDSNGSFSVSNNRFIALTPGYYPFSAVINWNTGAGLKLLSYRVNGGVDNYIASVTGVDRVFGGGAVYLNANDYLEIWARQDSGGGAVIYPGSSNSTFTINRLSGNNAVAQVESVNFSYEDTTSSAIGTTSAVYTYATRIKDTNNLYSGGTYPIPYSGEYRFSASIGTANVALGTTQALRIDICKNGTPFATGWALGNGGAATTYFAQATRNYPFLAGDLVTVKVTSNVATTNVGLSSFSHFSGERVGN